MVKCIGSAKMGMVATVVTKLVTNQVEATGKGTFERYQDPDSGEILTRFVPESTASPDSYQVQAGYDIPCYARGYTDLGFRSSANREIYLRGDYDVFEAIEFTYPAQYTQVGRQSFITNIRMKNKEDVPLWTEEETGESTVFQVQGVTPVFDVFGRLREWTAVLIRADIQ